MGFLDTVHSNAMQKCNRGPKVSLWSPHNTCLLTPPPFSSFIRFLALAVKWEQIETKGCGWGGILGDPSLMNSPGFGQLLGLWSDIEDWWCLEREGFCWLTGKCLGTDDFGALSSISHCAISITPESWTPERDLRTRHKPSFCFLLCETWKSYPRYKGKRTQERAGLRKAITFIIESYEHKTHHPFRHQETPSPPITTHLHTERWISTDLKISPHTSSTSPFIHQLHADFLTSLPNTFPSNIWRGIHLWIILFLTNIRAELQRRRLLPWPVTSSP